MKTRLTKIIVSLVGGIMAIGGGGFLYLEAGFPKISAAPQITIERTPARLARGRYLAEHVAACMDCHSNRDFSRFAGPVISGSEGQGGMSIFDEKIGMPGHVYPPNITPAHLADWTDGEILRAMTEGVSKDGRPLFPLMPYPQLAELSKEDAYSIVAYIRTLKPIENEVPATQLNFPMNLIVRTIPRAVQLAERAPDPADSVAHGHYLVKVAACADCHTQREKGQPIPGMDFAGGAKFPFPNGAIAQSSNLTPDAETGIGNWTREAFIHRFRNIQTPRVGASGTNTVMPWQQFSGMTDQDLGAIYDYLRTLKPVKNQVNQLVAPGSAVARD